jgi:pyridoxamine 5'-phosphate oxidase
VDIGELRGEYTHNGLRHRDLLEDPAEQFALWFQQACSADIIEPNAMTLATVSADSRPTTRTVLLKYFDVDGFVFFTNLESNKAHPITLNPCVSLLFPWLKLERQLIIDGDAERISTKETLRYFLTRPRGSQLGAWVSHQSSVISSRQLLEMKFDEMKRRFARGEVPLPSFWGGYRVRPTRFEFWQGRPNRLHDRFQYTQDMQGGWTIERLAP